MRRASRRLRVGQSLVGLSLAIVVLLWIHAGGLGALVGGGAPGVESLGRIAGLLSSDLLLVQVLLMARVPLIERAFGQDRLAGWHRTVGFTSINLMLAHIVFVWLAYAGEAGASLAQELWDMVTQLPGMLLATAGTVALGLVAITSMRANRAKLRYESWHLLHLYAYVGVGLALPHQLWTGPDFVGFAWATAYWWTLYAVVAAALLAFRFGLPIWRNWRHRLSVSYVIPEGPGVTSVYLSGQALEKLPARSGQFFQWRFLDGPGWSRAHPFSLSASPRTGMLRITVKESGDGSARVAALRPGTRALIEGPFGAMTGADYHGGPVVVVACGIGVTPLLAILADLPFRPGEATLIYRARDEDQVALKPDIDWLTANRGLRVIYALGPRVGPDSWRPQRLARFSDAEALLAAAPHLAAAQVYICGPAGWTDFAAAGAREAGVAEEYLHIEQFAW